MTTPAAAGTGVRSGRGGVALVGLLAATWLLQVWRPQLAYPEFAPLQLAALAVALVVGVVVAARGGGGLWLPAGRAGRVAMACGVGFAAWTVGRFAADGSPSVGFDNYGTYLGCVAWTAASAMAFGAARGGTSRRTATAAATCALAGLGVACGVHALWQYTVGYDRELARLSARIAAAGSDPDVLEIGLLHHLRLKRVASVWGDPNTLAAFAAVTIPAGLGLVSGRGLGAWGKMGGIATLAAAAVSIDLSGSRGGVVDAILAVGLWLYLGKTVRDNARITEKSRFGDRLWRFFLWLVLTFSISFLVGLVTSIIVTPWMNTFPFVIFFLFIGEIPAVGGFRRALGVPNQTDLRACGWTEAVVVNTVLIIGLLVGDAIGPRFPRLDTVIERVSYAKVGAAIAKRAPVTGSGLGAVDLFYGRFKPPEAREAKYLHNWPLQLTVELGLTGAALAAAWLAAMLARRSPRRLARRDPFARGAWCVVAILAFDGLLQVTVNQRELMALLGLAAGALIALPDRRARPGFEATAVKVDAAFRRVRDAQGTRRDAASTLGAEPRPERPIGLSSTPMERMIRASAAGALVAGLLVFQAWPVSRHLEARSQRYWADDLMEEGRVDEAGRAVARALAVCPADVQAWMAKARIEEARSGPAAAAAPLAEALRRQPESASLHARLAGVELARGRVPQAESLARRALKLYPANAEHRTLLARVLEAAGDLPGATAEARRAVADSYLHRDRRAAYLARIEAKAGSLASTTTTSATVPSSAPRP